VNEVPAAMRFVFTIGVAIFVIVIVVWSVTA
jgi:hypothetical protein